MPRDLALKERRSFDAEHRPQSRADAVKLVDKNPAIASLSKILGLVTNKVSLEGSLELRLQTMSAEERVARVLELRAKARDIYLPRYRAMQASAEMPMTIDGEADHITGHGNGANGGDQQRTGRDEVLGEVDADAYALPAWTTRR